LRGAVVAHACALAVRRLVSEVSVGSVGAWGNGTTRSRVAGGRRWVGAAGCSALMAWRWVRCIAAGVTPRAATMFGMDTPATIRNKTISRSGLGSVAISAGSRAQCLASTHRWLGPRESGGATGAGVVGGRIGGGATDIRSRAPLPGSAAVLVPRIPVAGLGCRPWDPVGSWPTGVCAAQPTSASHAGRDPRGQCGAIGGTPVRGAIVADRDGPARRMATPQRLGSAQVAELSCRRGPERAQRIVAGCIDSGNPCG
jgi:hypothetical protein